MSKSDTTENDFIKAVFAGTDPSWRATAGQANLYLALHSSDPGEAGIQTTNEVVYTGYGRVPVVRSGSGWTVSGDHASNTALAQFPVCAGGSVVATHVSIGLGDTGAGGQILYSGALNDPLAISNLIQPQFAIGALVVTED